MRLLYARHSIASAIGFWLRRILLSGLSHFENSNFCGLPEELFQELPHNEHDSAICPHHTDTWHGIFASRVPEWTLPSLTSRARWLWQLQYSKPHRETLISGVFLFRKKNYAAPCFFGRRSTGRPLTRVALSVSHLTGSRSLSKPTTLSRNLPTYVVQYLSIGRPIIFHIVFIFLVH